MVSSKAPSEFEPEEIARRRDEVVRRMANTAPQPHDRPKPHSQENKKPTVQDRAAPKARTPA